MKDVKVKKGNNNENQLIVKMFQSGSNRTRPENYFEVPINAQIYGYKSEELKDIITKYLSQQDAPRAELNPRPWNSHQRDEIG